MSGDEGADLLLFPPAGGLQSLQTQGGFGQHGAFFILVEFLPAFDFTLATPAADADVIGEFAEADAGVFHGGISQNPCRSELVSRSFDL